MPIIDVLLVYIDRSDSMYSFSALHRARLAAAYWKNVANCTAYFVHPKSYFISCVSGVIIIANTLPVFT
jgi:hypothetical protein